MKTAVETPTKPLAHPVVGMRHLKDIDALGAFGFNAPIETNADNDSRLARAVDEIALLVRATGCRSVRLLFSESLVRLRETAHRVGEHLGARLGAAVNVQLIPDPRLSALDQGTLSLPSSYRDGTHLSALDTAWDAFCSAAYEAGNIDYPFGSASVGDSFYRELEETFRTPGDSVRQFLIRQYAFLEELFLSQPPAESKEIVVFCGQSPTLFLLHEIFEIERSKVPVTPEELHFACWQVYKRVVEEKQPEAFGQVSVFDLGNLNREKWIAMLRHARIFLEERERVPPESVQARIDRHSNDYSKYDGLFADVTGRTLDDKRPLPREVPFAPTSIVIPYYNARGTIFDVLDSIAAQRLTPEDFKLLEVVVVDDGARDGLAQELAKRTYPFELKVVTCEVNGGRSRARNRGAKVASHDILMFVDADNVLSGEVVREHAVRNKVAPSQLYTSLVCNISHEKLREKVGEDLKMRTPIPAPAEFNEYRTREVVTVGSPGATVVEDTVIEIMKATNNFRAFGFGRRLGPYDLPSMFATYCVSVTKELFERIGGFDESFRGWGMEDAFFGAQGVALGAKIVPILSCGSYSIEHASHSGSEERERSELEGNIRHYRTLLRKAP